MLGLYDFERFDCSYLDDAIPFMKTKPALSLKPTKAEKSPVPAKTDSKAAASKSPVPAKTPIT